MRFVASGSGAAYGYDQNGNTTDHPFAHYQLENDMVVKYYTFGGQTIAMRRGSTLYYLHADHLGGTGSSQQYCVYGKQRNGTSCTSGNSLATDKHFTGQLYDDTGFHYYNSRYYDDHLGHFISPDTIVPDATSVFEYNWTSCQVWLFRLDHTKSPIMAISAPHEMAVPRRRTGVASMRTSR